MPRTRWLFPFASAAVALLVAASPATPRPAIAFQHRAGLLVVSAPGYRLALSDRNGRLVTLRERGDVLVDGGRCLWGMLGESDTSYVGGCSFARTGTHRFSYRWDARRSRLTLTYSGQSFGSSVVTVLAHAHALDLQMTLANRGRLRSRIRFPDGLGIRAADVVAGYAPNVLPGVRLAPGFFSRVGTDVQIYPSRWAFADYLALDERGGSVALYTVAPARPHPAAVGFFHAAAPSLCSGPTACVLHEFETWVQPGTTWRSPVVRLQVGETVRQSILAYRHDNGIDAYPSLASKLGGRLSALASAPLLKADLRLLKPFARWAPDLQRLPSPVLLHPVAFTAGGHDVNDPDFLPPDPRFGTDADFAAMIGDAHARGDLVMPYLNLSWWDPNSPTMRAAQANEVAVLDENGNPVSISYGDHTGVIVSPYSAFVRTRMAQEMQRWQTDVPADCVFLDQLGARPWLRDFNPASPAPDAYDDGWLAFLHEYANRCVMVEDGWDRLARDATGFQGGLLMMSRELDLGDTFFGAGNWQPYPLADWLFHDKVLMYEHDLYPGTMAADPEVLLWNTAFGYVESEAWTGDASFTDPWLALASLLQRDLGPHYAGVPLSSYSDVAPGVTQSVFGDLTVVSNWNADTAHDGIAPLGFRATAPGIVAGAFAGSFNGVALSPGAHYLVVESSGATTTVRQPIGSDTDVAVPASPGAHVTALAADGSALATVPSIAQNGTIVFRYVRDVAAYRVSG